MASRIIRAIGPAVLFTGQMLSGASPVAAECTALDPWPDFADAIPTASRIIVGEVTKDQDPNSGLYLSVFGLRIDKVIRGDDRVGQVLNIRYLASGLPGRVCPGDTHLTVRRGDVIALGLNALAPDGRTRINVVAWLGGAPDPMQVGVGPISITELHALVAMPATDTLSAPANTSTTSAFVALTGLLSALLACVVRARRV